jgi:hypothetical protein
MRQIVIEKNTGDFFPVKFTVVEQERQKNIILSFSLFLLSINT